jgi:cell division control protein 6
MTVVVVDELDGLLSKPQEVLYRLFGWPKLTNSKMILVGIANSMHLTDRFLPR